MQNGSVLVFLLKRESLIEMTYILGLVFGLLLTVFAEKPCEKLKYIGDNIQNKAVLSPIVITGTPGMKMDLSNAQYKLTINILSIIKGSLGQWNRSILIAGNFSVFNDFKNPCHFQSESEGKQIYFLQVNSDVNGEYNLLFNPETSNMKKLAAITATKCADCAKPPIITIKDESTNDLNIVDCIGNGSPPPVVKWTISKSSSKPKIEVIKNGSRVSQSISNSSNEMYTCKAMNALGNASYGVILKTMMVKPPKTISRCSSKDIEQCNGQGKCYEDKTEGNIIFCRCNEGFEGPKCANNPIKLPDTLIQPTPKLDSLNCNNNGKAYENWKTKAKTCMCDSGYFGENCEKKILSRTADKETISRCSSKDIEQCNGQGRCYEDKTEGNIIFCRCNEGFEGPKCTNVSKKLPDTLIQQIPKLDSINCNNNGKAFENWNTKEIFCICDFSFFGVNCEKKKDVTSKDEVRILNILETSTTKMAAKYILIGCLIVLGGCILILIVILCLWKYYFSKYSKKAKDEEDEDDDEEEEDDDEAANQAFPKSFPDMMAFKNQYLEQNSNLLTKDDLNTIPKNVIPSYNAEINIKGNESNLFSGSGIYDNN